MDYSCRLNSEQVFQSNLAKNIFGKNPVYILGRHWTLLHLLSLQAEVSKYEGKKWKKFFTKLECLLPSFSNFQFIFVYTWWGLVERIIFEDLRYDKLHLIIGRITKFQNLNFQMMKKFCLGNERRVFLGNWRHKNNGYFLKENHVVVFLLTPRLLCFAILNISGTSNIAMTAVSSTKKVNWKIRTKFRQNKVMLKEVF